MSAGKDFLAREVGQMVANYLRVMAEHIDNAAIKDQRIKQLEDELAKLKAKKK